MHARGRSARRAQEHRSERAAGRRAAPKPDDASAKTPNVPPGTTPAAAPSDDGVDPNVHRHGRGLSARPRGRHAARRRAVRAPAGPLSLPDEAPRRQRRQARAPRLDRAGGGRRGDGGAGRVGDARHAGAAPRRRGGRGEARRRARRRAPRPRPIRRWSRTVRTARCRSSAPMDASPGRSMRGQFDAADKRPRIALVVARARPRQRCDARTRSTVCRPQVTLAFSPYARDLEGWIAAARRAGHEVLLGLPMEPTDYPRQDPGPKTLLTSLEPEQESRAPALGAGPRHGLCRARRRHGRALRRRPRQPRAGARSVEDARPAVRRRSRCVGRRRRRRSATRSAWPGRSPTGGSISEAIAADGRQGLGRSRRPGASRTAPRLGLGALYPVTLDRVVAWAGSLQGKGFALAPATAVATRQKLRGRRQ